MRLNVVLGLIVLPALLSGCMHLKGVVVDGGTGRPLRTAKLNVGRPDSVANFGIHSVDDQGRFDFYVSPTDSNIIFVFDSIGSPERTLRRLDPTELNDHMRVEVIRLPGTIEGLHP